MLYDCRDTGGFFDVTVLWISLYPPTFLQNTMATCGQQYKNYRDNRFVYGYVTKPLLKTLAVSLELNSIHSRFSYQWVVSYRKRAVV